MFLHIFSNKKEVSNKHGTLSNKLGTLSENDKTNFGANFQKYRLSVYTFLNIRSRVGDKHFESTCSIKSSIPNNATQTNV